MSDELKQMADENADDSSRMHLACCEMVLLNEIAEPSFKRKDIAKTYRLAMVAQRDNGEVIDWGKVNAAIIARWSKSGLTWIKEQAWSGKCFAPSGTAR